MVRKLLSQFSALQSMLRSCCVHLTERSHWESFVLLPQHDFCYVSARADLRRDRAALSRGREAATLLPRGRVHPIIIINRLDLLVRGWGSITTWRH